jgi:hypothetical protein
VIIVDVNRYLVGFVETEISYKDKPEALVKVKEIERILRTGK